MDNTEHSFALNWTSRTKQGIAPVGLGTVAFGRSTGLKYAKPVVRPNDGELLRLLSTARTSGINLLDTATAYGDSQARLGALVADDPHWVVMTKIGERHRAGRSTYDFSPAALEADLLKARNDLRRSPLDIVLLHSHGQDEAALLEGAAFATLKQARNAGTVNTIGASLKTPQGIEAAWTAGAEVLMLTLNQQEPELGPWIEESAARGIRVVIKKPLASGTLSISSLGWVAAQPGVSSIIVGTLNPEHLRANVAAVTQTLPGEGSS